MEAILNAAGLNVNIPENLVILNYEQHKHLHTNRYHARVFMDMLRACLRVLDNSNVERCKDYLKYIKYSYRKHSKFFWAFFCYALWSNFTKDKY